MSKVITADNATRADFPVGTVAFSDYFGREYRVTNETVAVLFDNDGNVCDLANNIDTAIAHVQDGQGTALALTCEYGDDIEDVQAMLDYHREVYADCFAM